jgi:hypothetical protein
VRTWHAAIDTSDMLRRWFYIKVAHETGYGKVEYLMPDGTMKEVEEGVDPGESGIRIHYAALPAIAEALQAHLGNSLPSQAEVAVLREVLEKEQKRVDTALAVALAPTVHPQPPTIIGGS